MIWYQNATAGPTPAGQGVFVRGDLVETPLVSIAIGANSLRSVISPAVAFEGSINGRIQIEGFIEVQNASGADAIYTIDIQPTVDGATILGNTNFQGTIEGTAIAGVTVIPFDFTFFASDVGSGNHTIEVRVINGAGSGAAVEFNTLSAVVKEFLAP